MGWFLYDRDLRHERVHLSSKIEAFEAPKSEILTSRFFEMSNKRDHLCRTSYQLFNYSNIISCKYRSSHRMRSIKKLFLKISQTSQDNISTRVSLARVFSCQFCEIFKNTFFTQHLRATISVNSFNEKLQKQTLPCRNIFLNSQEKLSVWASWSLKKLWQGCFARNFTKLLETAIF